MESLRNMLKKVKKDSVIGLYFYNVYRTYRDKVWSSRKRCDLELVTESYYKSMGSMPYLKNPQKLSEKYCWMKLFYRDENMCRCADKYLVLGFLEERGYVDLCNDMFAIFDSVNEIDFNKLPNQFVIKATHGSGMNLICKDKRKLNWFWWKKIMNQWLKQDISIEGGEWVYHGIKPRLICEKYLEAENGKGIPDYKITCSYGKIVNILVVSGRFEGNKCMTYYNENWERQNYTDLGECIGDEDRPSQFDLMKQIARDLSREFPLVRVDFYCVKNKLYFGELTFFDGGGHSKYDPLETDMVLGKEVRLPIPNFNLKDYEAL